MTMDELKAALEADQEKAKAFEKTLAGITKEQASSDAEAISLAAKAVGYEVTPEEVERALAAHLEADDAELENVAGGGWFGMSEESDGHDIWCLGVAWHCYYTFLHTSAANGQTACWSDYQCGGDFYKTCNNTYRSWCNWAWETKD